MRIKIKTRLSPTTLCLLTQISLRPRFLRKTNVMNTIKGAIYPLKSMSLRLLRKTKIRPKIKAISNIPFVNKRVTILANTLKS